MNTISIIELILIAVALSMDAFAVSISDGLTMAKTNPKRAFVIAGFFGGFQALMPLVGYFLGSAFTDIISQWDHIIALLFLGYIGGKMVFDGVKAFTVSAEVKCDEKPLSTTMILVQAVATSIDALIVGISFAAMKVSIVPAVLLIGIITFALCIVGVFAGKKFGKLLGEKAEILGGVVLIGIGLKVFIEHVFF